MHFIEEEHLNSFL